MVPSPLSVGGYCMPSNFKRGNKDSKDFRRRGSIREPYDYVLIVCEGSKTEPRYFDELCRYLRIHNANVIIAKNDEGTNPLSVVACALKEYKDDPEYDHVFCVFDRDKHPDFAAAIEKITATRLRGKASIHAITSIPCFEYWILLHFDYTTRQFTAAEGSNCNEVIGILKQYVPDYKKKMSVFEIVKSKTATAIENAKKVERFHETSGTDNPSTKVYELVEYLQNIKSVK